MNVQHAQFNRVRRHAHLCFFTLAGIALQLCSWQPLSAQHRDPAPEIYGLTGAYYFGQDPHVLKSRQWSPQAGVGGLFPVGSKWALMIDGLTSRLEVNEGPHGIGTAHPFSEFYRLNPGVQNNDVTTQRLIAILPSVVRLWRRERFSIYFGGGFGMEHQRQRIRYQPAHEQELPDGSTTLVRAEEFVESRDSLAIGSLVFSAGILINIAPRVVMRAGWSLMPGYLDTPISQAPQVGIGYRF